VGRGRGRHYGREHVERLRQVKDLQAAGHSLEAIKRILDGERPPASASPRRHTTRAAGRLTAQLWTRIHLAEGAELQLDMAKHNVDVNQLIAIQQAVEKILRRGTVGDSEDEQNSRKKGAQT
jgi:DNA-binding transcriptional MerR regulator